MTSPGAEIDVTARLTASLNGVAAMIDRANQYAGFCGKAEVQQVPLTAPQANAAGIIDYPDLLAVKTGYYWSVRRLALSGFTAGTALVCLNGVGGEPVAAFAQAAVFTFGRGELLMHPGDRLVVAATGITGTVQLNGAADCFLSWYLPWYIG